MIGRSPRAAAGRIPAVFAISLLLLLSACSQYGPMNRKPMSLDPSLAGVIGKEDLKLQLTFSREGGAPVVLGPGGEPLQRCAPNEVATDNPCRLISQQSVDVKAIESISATIIDFEHNPICQLIKVVIGGTPYYFEHCG